MRVFGTRANFLKAFPLAIVMYATTGPPIWIGVDASSKKE